MLIPKITTYNTKDIPKMYQEGWRLITIYDGMIFWEKEEKRVVAKNAITETPDFQNWYELYPKHKARPQALKEWNRLTPEEIEQIKELLPLHIQYWKSKYGREMKRGKECIKDLTYVPYPSSWLSAKSWNDDIEIEGKSKDDILKEKELLHKRREQEIERRKEEETERQESEEISLIIRRLKEHGKYRELETLAREKAPVDSLQFTIDFIARSIVGQNPNKWKSLYL